MGFANRRQCIVSVHLYKENGIFEMKRNSDEERSGCRDMKKIMIDYISHMLNNFLFNYQFIEIKKKKEKRNVRVFGFPFSVNWMNKFLFGNF